MARQYQYGMIQGAVEEGLQNVAMNVANELNAKIRERALYVLKHSGFFPESEYDNLEEYDEFRELCMELGHAFLKGFESNFIYPFECD